VSLTPNEGPDSVFVAWTGACSGSGGCTVTMNSDQTVSAQFDVVPAFVTLTVNKSGGGSGTVTDGGGLIVCGAVCQATYPRGLEITLTATPDPDSRFDEWQGGPCNNQSVPCVLLMDRNRTAEANFDRIGNGGGGGGGGGDDDDD
jgi:hypothetical protein